MRRAAFGALLSALGAMGEVPAAAQTPYPATPVTPLPPAPAAPYPAAAPAAPADAPAAPAAPATTTAAADAKLERVLRSGCRDGLAGVYALAGDPSAPWAPTVLRLCGRILRDEAAAPAGRTTAVATTEGLRAAQVAAQSQEGRGRLVIWSSVYGLWLGIATDILFDITGDRPVILAPILGMSTGLALSLGLSSNVPITAAQAWTIITGLDYGTFNGALWAGGLDASDKAIVGTAVTTGLAAAAAGLAVADAARPSAGDIELVRSGLLWGTAAGFLAMRAATDQYVSGTTVALGTAIAMDAGFVGGLLLARQFDLSKNRVLIMDAGGLAGTLAGFSVAWLSHSDDGTDHSQLLAGSALAGLVLGLGISAFATRNIDDDPRSYASLSTTPALLALDPDGHWRPGTPSPTPVFDGAGRRLVGATVGAVGGRF